MAQRRMFSKGITQSSKFSRMPDTCRLLYYDLGMSADDDGYCEWFPVLQMTGAKEQDLEILQANRFVQVFDKEVLVIRDWKENNFNRSDRYTPSKYLGVYEDIGLPSGIPTVYQRLPQVRLGKVSINNVNGTKEEGRKNSEPKTSLHGLPNLERDREEIKLIADDIVAVLGDEHSRHFYTLVAMKIPENVIRQKLAEIKQGGAHSPAKAFTSAMKTYATTTLQKREMFALTSARQELLQDMRP